MADKNSSSKLQSGQEVDWNDLRTVVAVNRAGSLRGAARAMGINHATVNRRLMQLESALGSRLFERRPEGFVLTQAGEDVLSVAERMEGDLLAVERRIGGRDDAPYGTVRLNIPPAMLNSFLPGLLAEFAQTHPDIELDVDASHTFADLAGRDADISIRMDSQISDDVVARKIVDYAKAIYATPEVADKVVRKEAGAATYCWIGWGPNMPYRGFPKGTPFPDLPVRHALFSNALQVGAAKAGLGLALLPCFLGDPEPGLIRVPGTGLLPGKSLWLLFHDDLRHTARIRALIDYLVPAIRAQRALLEGEVPS